MKLLFSTLNFKNLIENSVMYLKYYGSVTANQRPNMHDPVPRMNMGILSILSCPPSSIFVAQELISAVQGEVKFWF